MAVQTLPFGLPTLWDSPTQALLQSAEELRTCDDMIGSVVGSRVLAMSATAMAVFEALGHALLAGATIPLAIIKTPIVLGLRAGFLGTWVFSLWVADKLLTKSVVRWVQFTLLQVILLRASPRGWSAQWAQWKDMFKGLGTYANKMADDAYALDAFVERWAGWEHARHHIGRAGKLTWFACKSSSQAWLDPKKVIDGFDKVIPWPRNFDDRCAEWVQGHKGLIGICAAVAGAALLHYNCEGYETRGEWGETIATKARHVTAGSIGVGCEVVPWVFNHTVGTAWSMWKGPISAVANALHALIDIANALVANNQLTAERNRLLQQLVEGTEDRCPAVPISQLFDS